MVSPHIKGTITAQQLLGRPFRRDWKDAQDKQTADRLAQKDAERRARSQME